MVKSMNALLSLEVTHCWKDRPQTYVNNTVLYVDTVVHIDVKFIWRINSWSSMTRLKYIKVYYYVFFYCLSFRGLGDDAVLYT